MVVIIRSIDQKGFHFSLPILPISISCDLKQRKLGSSRTSAQQDDCCPQPPRLLADRAVVKQAERWLLQGM